MSRPVAAAGVTLSDGGRADHVTPYTLRGQYLIVEAVKRLRGACGTRQAADADVACVSGTGDWFCSSGTMLLGRD
jgi:hypothetical protein